MTSTSTLDQVNAELVCYYRRRFRIWPDEEIHAFRDDHCFMLVSDFADRDNASGSSPNLSRVHAHSIIAAADAELAWRRDHDVSRGPVDVGWSRAFLDGLKSRISIEDEIGKIVALRRHGSALSGCCPLHPDHYPSLVVWPDRGQWRCFGACATGGDVIAWAQAVNQMAFPDAVMYLAERAGIALPARQHQRVVRLDAAAAVRRAR